MDTKQLLIQGTKKLGLTFIIIAVLLFLPAGTLDYPGAWLFMILLFTPMIMAGLVLISKDPELLEKRLTAKEKEPEQKTVLLMSCIMFIAGLVSAGLNFRFKWFIMPNKIIIGAAAVFLLSYLTFAEVMRENTYLSCTFEIQKGQKVIDTGLYRIVRHPMYTSTVFLFLSVPLMLGSVISFIIFCSYIFITVKRINSEERLLSKELPGYEEYMKKVRYRLIPFVW